MNIVIGDLLQSDCGIRCHQVNCRGVMGSGLAKQVKEKYPECFKAYHFMCQEYGSDMLGDVQFVKCHDGTTIANLFSQDAYGVGRCHTDYGAFGKGVMKVFVEAKTKGLSVGFPYLIGCDRGGGDWSIVSKIIDNFADELGVPCFVYKLEAKK